MAEQSGEAQIKASFETKAAHTGTTVTRKSLQGSVVGHNASESC